MSCMRACVCAWVHGCMGAWVCALGFTHNDGGVSSVTDMRYHRPCTEPWPTPRSSLPWSPCCRCSPAAAASANCSWSKASSGWSTSWATLPWTCHTPATGLQSWLPLPRRAAGWMHALQPRQVGGVMSADPGNGVCASPLYAASIHTSTEDLEGPSHSIKAFKAAAVITVREYLDSGDAQEVATRLLELGDPGMHHLFVKHVRGRCFTTTAENCSKLCPTSHTSYDSPCLNTP